MDKIRKLSAQSWLLIVLLVSAFALVGPGNDVVEDIAWWSPIALIILLAFLIGSVQNDWKEES